MRYKCGDEERGCLVSYENRNERNEMQDGDSSRSNTTTSREEERIGREIRENTV